MIQKPLPEARADSAQILPRKPNAPQEGSALALSYENGTTAITGKATDPYSVMCLMFGVFAAILAGTVIVIVSRFLTALTMMRGSG